MLKRCITLTLVSLAALFNTKVNAIENAKGTLPDATSSNLVPFTVCTNSWTPFIDDKLPSKGKSWRIIKEIMEVQNYKAELELMPWARAVKSVRDGDCDALPDAFYTEERSQWALFSEPYDQVNTVFFKRVDRELKPYESYDDLKGLRIGIIRGAAVTPEFDQTVGLQKVEVRDIRQGFSMLYAGRLDLQVTEDLPGLYELELMSKKYPSIGSKLVIINPYLATNSLHLAISKNSENASKILNDFNQGLAKLKSSGRYQQIMNDYK